MIPVAFRKMFHSWAAFQRLTLKISLKKQSTCFHCHIQGVVAESMVLFSSVSALEVVLTPGVLAT